MQSCIYLSFLPCPSKEFRAMYVVYPLPFYPPQSCDRLNKSNWPRVTQWLRSSTHVCRSDLYRLFLNFSVFGRNSLIPAYHTGVVKICNLECGDWYLNEVFAMRKLFVMLVNAPENMSYFSRGGLRTADRWRTSVVQWSLQYGSSGPSSGMWVPKYPLFVLLLFGRIYYYSPNINGKDISLCDLPEKISRTVRLDHLMVERISF